jgi:phosphotransferase system HPr (HPr) family protein
MKVSKQVIIKTPLGLHARPAMEVVQILQKSSSRAKITHEERTIDAHSIISLLSLAAPCGAVITITIEGADATATLKKLIAALSKDALAND